MIFLPQRIIPTRSITEALQFLREFVSRRFHLRMDYARLRAENSFFVAPCLCVRKNSGAQSMPGVRAAFRTIEINSTPAD
jgi:hypothetical protein